MADTDTGERTAHPYHMYDAIRAQPDAVAATLASTADTVDALAARISGRSRLLLVGIGTSYHAALAAEQLFWASGAPFSVCAVQSLDFALYGPPLAPDDAVLVISHRGTKTYSLASLQRAHAAGCLTALLTGAAGTPNTPAETVILRTNSVERSSAFTVSYTTALAVLAALATRLGSAFALDTLTQVLPSVMRAALDSEPQMAALAQEHTAHRRIWLAGAGPAAITAQEIALKIKETSYLQAEGMSTEMLLHGPFQCAEADDLFVLIAPAGPAQERTLALARKAEAIGATALIVADELPPSADDIAAARCFVPAVPEAYSTLTYLVPLQLFSYHLALACGTNPDGFRLNDPRFARAHRLAQL